MENKQEMFIWLEKVRRGGSINMYCVAPYLEVAFNLTYSEAISVASEWMDTYKDGSQYNDVEGYIVLPTR